MSNLYLVRHGQATFHAASYDQLSEIGEAQARRLGRFWLDRRVAIDEVYTGPACRHRQTAEFIGELYRCERRHWPTPVILPELDEHRVEGLIRNRIEEITSSHPSVEPLAAAYARSKTTTDTERSFQRLFEAVTQLWIRDEVVDSTEESWTSFRERVQSGIEQMRNGGGSGRIVVAFTSVGPIAAALRFALACSDQTAVELGWRIRNCSLTQFVFTTGRFTLDRFNSLPHLDDDDLLTYR